MSALAHSEPASSPSRLLDDDALWSAVARRDAACDGDFVYAVATTGVYCRPSCPSRQARREHLTFHLTCEAAEAAGFRACKRCRPNGASQQSRHAALVTRACATIAAAEAAPTLDALAAAAGLSPFHFHRVFKAATGVTPNAYGAALKAQRVKKDLLASETITEAIYGAGYGSSSRFYERSGVTLGMQPSVWRDRGRGELIRFALGECSLGAVLVAATERGLCAIEFGDAPAPLLQDLQDRFANADLIGGDHEFEQLVARVVAAVEDPRQALGLPLDVRGTAFQERVWRALRDVPLGDVASYADVAARIGAPKAVRAVAQACAANPTALAIPCHRIVRTDGALSGYRWGVARKAELLAREKRLAAAQVDA